MNPTLTQTLQNHYAVCQELLTLAEQENRALKDADSASTFTVVQQRKALLTRLNESLAAIKAERAKLMDKHIPADTAKLFRQVQDLIMRILVLDRENEQALLRRGLIPARHVPPAAAQKPHFVAGLYQRQSGSGS